MLSANEIRAQFIDFFVQKHGHRYIPSSSVIPHDDPTLLFANAGMNQFKPIFLGLEKRDYTRAANTQKCIRAGGKHNDLDDVGRDTYHHTFFEMLGNWSFGDYFKKEAISWAWELLTKVWGIDPERLHVTVFEGDEKNGVPRDDEAADIWHLAAGVPRARIHYGNKKDNFWEMGSTGPCGPCTEIHIDRTPDKSGGPLVNAGVPEVMEIWNLVFIQFNRNEDQTLTPLPAKHVDTGMGFERVTSVLQGKSSNYDTDVFTPIFDNIRDITKGPAYTGSLTNQVDVAYRVIADHIRSVVFSLTDGGMPDKDGRGSIIRSILRRAELFGWLGFSMREPFLHQLVPGLVNHMGAAFPELKRNPEKVRSLIYDEEKAFLRTIDRGLKLFDDAERKAKAGNTIITGETAFKLHTEQGFFIDITEKLATDRGIKVDRNDFETRYKKFQEDSGKNRQSINVTAIQGNLPSTDDSFKYQPEIIEATVLGWVKDNAVISQGSIGPGEAVALLLDRTNFYGEQGGQKGDTGMIRSQGGADFEVTDTQRLGNSVAHLGVLEQGSLSVGDKVSLVQTTSRRINIMRNHTATHLLNLGLRQVLGGDIDQKGSEVDHERTRFDFSHAAPLTPDELKQVEEIVNDRIMRNMQVLATVMPLGDAKNIPGVRAVFGEKYPDPVRVISIGPDDVTHARNDDSIEFCGGTHVPATGLIGSFKIISQEGVSKGVRRVTAITGPRALVHQQQLSSTIDTLTAKLNCSIADLPGKVDALQEEVKKLQKQIQKNLVGDLNSIGDQLIAKAIDVNGVKIVVGEVPFAPIDTMRSQVDRLRQIAKSCVIVLGWVSDENVPGLVVGLSEDVIKKGIKSNDIIKPVAEVIGGKGGGPPHLATAGGNNPGKLAEALAKAVTLAQGKLG